MGETAIFAIIVNLILIVFIIGFIVFFLEYHKRKLQAEQEKSMLNEQHASELFHTKMEIQQYTMQEIGREIHDNVNQQLTLASLYAYQLEAGLEDGAAMERISRIGNIINDTMDELRNLSKKLTHHDTENQTLLDLVDKECRRINALNICSATFHFNNPVVQVSDAIKNYLHRIIQEFLQNSIKHSGCKNITLDFEQSAGGLSVRLKDDGKGFDVSNYSAENKGIGLANMKKRSALLGIDFSIHSTVNEGTEVLVFIPENKPADGI